MFFWGFYFERVAKETAFTSPLNRVFFAGNFVFIHLEIKSIIWRLSYRFSLP